MKPIINLDEVVFERYAAPMENGGATLGVVLGGTQRLNPETGEKISSFDILDLDSAELRRIPITFLGHGATVWPKAPHIAAVFEKRGPGGVLVDLRAAKALRRIDPTAGRAFYGHAAYSLDGALLYVVETSLDTHAGIITVRDAESLQVRGEFPTFGEDPHDCVLVDDGKTLVITNGGGELGTAFAPSVTYVDIASQKLQEKHTFSDPKINAGHIAIAKNGDFVVSSAPRMGLPEQTTKGGVTIRVRPQKVERMKSPTTIVERLLGESLSVCIHEPTQIAAVTTPVGGIVTFWSIPKRKLTRSMDLEFPRGVTLTLDGRSFVVSSGKASPHLALYDAESLTEVATSYPVGCFSGSHIYTWDPA